MNKHFEDTRYYLKRALQEAKRGVSEELEPIQKRVDELLGAEEEPAQSRIDEIRAELQVVQEKAEGEAKEAIAETRERLATRTKAAE